MIPSTATGSISISKIRRASSAAGCRPAFSVTTPRRARTTSSVAGRAGASDDLTRERTRAGSESLVLKQRRAEVAFADAAHHRHDHLALVLRAGRDLGGGGDVSAAADAGEDAFLLVQPPRPRERFVV